MMVDLQNRNLHLLSDGQDLRSTSFSSILVAASQLFGRWPKTANEVHINICKEMTKRHN